MTSRASRSLLVKPESLSAPAPAASPIGPVGRRTVMLAGLSSGLLLAGCGAEGQNSALAAGEKEGDFAIGDPNAPVVLIEYASVMCVHCEAFHAQTYPTLKSRYIDEGLVRFIFREIPTAPAQLSMAGFLLARCAEPERYFDVINVLFSQRVAILQAAQAGGARDAYVRIARNAGISEEQFDACLRDREAITAIEESANAAGRDYGVQGTPAFIINGELTPGLRTVEDFAAVIDPLLGDRAPAPEAADAL